MQLSLPGVGYGVLESPVDSGNVYKRPFKRARTTGTYLAAATLGTDADRALIRSEVDRVHALVRSKKSSPLSYNAFDPRLQLWVAACLYRYYIDQHEYLYGPLDDESADAVYTDARKLGTTLQVRDDMWPADRIAFDEFWKRTLDELASPRRCASTCTGSRRWRSCPHRCGCWLAASTCSPQRLPSNGVPHADEDVVVGGATAPIQLAVGALRIADRVIPREVWILGYRMYLRDMRARARKGRRVV